MPPYRTIPSNEEPNVAVLECIPNCQVKFTALKQQRANDHVGIKNVSHFIHLANYSKFRELSL
jgi:hypothetical protein